MKKITLLLCLLVVSAGYSQTLLQGFESGGINGGPFGNMPAPLIEAGTGSNTSQVLKIVTNTGGEPWQGINLFLSPSTNLTVNKTLTIDVLSSTPITFLVKVNGGGIEAAAPVTHNGDGTWQTIPFTFDTSLDGKSDNPSGVYSGFVIHPYWEVGRTQFFTPTVVPKPARTFYVDNIREPAPAPLCTTVLGSTSATCNTFGVGATDDTYNATVAFSGGMSGNNFIVSASAGIIGGDDPNSVASGTITVSGITEGTNLTLTVDDTADGGVCSLTANVTSPVCLPPITGDVYINDNSLVGDVFCSAVGQNIGVATGSTSLPYKSITDLFADRVISPGATIHVDSGTYTGRTILQDNEDGTSGSVITIKGAGTGLTFLNSTLSNDAVMKFNDADYFTVTDMTISSATEFYQIWTTPGSTNCTFDNLVLVNTKSATQGWAYVLQGSFATITNNSISSTYAGIIALTGSNNTLISKNKIVGNNGTNGIWFSGPSTAHTVTNNMVSNFKQAFRSDGTTTSNCNIYNNSFSGTEFGCVGYMTGWNVKNNIFSTSSNNTGQTALWYGAAQPPATLDHNLYYHPNAARAVTVFNTIIYASLADFVGATAYEDNGVEGNPLFVSATDLHLQSGSPAIGAGTDVGVTEDIDGDPRPLSGNFDIGADQFIATVSSVATLSDLQVDGVSISGFSPVTTDYTVEVSCSDSSIPQITSATTTNPLASVVITQATDVFEDATVVVTAEDGITTETYTVRIALVRPDIIQDFEPPATYTGLTGDNGTAATIASSPGGITGNSLQLDSTVGGATFQAGYFDQVSDFVALTPENNTVQVDVYSTQAFNLRLKLEIGGTPIERTVQYTTPNTWQTLTFDFGAVTATYSRIVFFLNSNATNDGFLASQGFTAFVDNIRLSSVQTEQVTYTYDNGGWLPSDPAGNYGCKDILNIVAGDLTMTADTEVDTITIAAGASLSVEPGVTLTAGTVNLNSTSSTFSSLIVNGTVDGDVNYSRFTSVVGTNDLIASPVSGQAFGDFATANTNLAASGTLRAFAPYNTSAGAYQNYDTVLNAGTGISPGTGYRMATTDGSPLTFTGTVSDADVLDISITDAAAGNAWNLIGNPYPSYVDFATFFDLNKTEFETGAFQAIYGYNGTGWTVWNETTILDIVETELITPGQGFFVKSKASGGLVDFTTAMRTFGTSDDFISGRSSNTLNVASSKLILSNAAQDAKTSIYFIEGKTRGLDSGFDAAAFRGSASDFSIFTNLVENNEGLDMDIQTLGYDDFNDVIIPLGIKALAGSALTIKLDENSNLPSNINVYLEDTVENTLTFLNTSTYSFVPTNDLVGAGRFFLNYSSSTLSLDTDNALNQLLIYSNQNTKDITIKGVLNAATKADLYDLQGRVVMTHSLNQSDLTNTIDVSSLSTGVYIIKVSNKNNTKTQKLIIK